MKAPSLLLLATALTASAWVIPMDRGAWPADWPKQLEPLRERSRTTQWATGNQEDSHQIPFTDRAEFETLWPVFAKMLKAGAHLNLVSPAKEASSVQNLTKASVIVHTSPRNTGEIASGDDRPSLKTGPPFPKSALLPNGTLPEYVRVEEIEGQNTWVPVVDDKRVGFQFRARTDITLVCDGKVIDLKWAKVPKGVVVNDRQKK